MPTGPASVFIRTASERDLEAVRALLVETWHNTYDGIYGVERVTEITDDWHSLRALRARLTRPNSEFLVADEGRAVVGMAFAVAVEDGFTIVLHQLYVLPARQRQGAGSLLLAEIEGSFTKARRVRLEVEAANDKGLAFYRKAGFSEVGPSERPGIPSGSGEKTHLIFEKDL